MTNQEIKNDESVTNTTDGENTKVDDSEYITSEEDSQDSDENTQESDENTQDQESDENTQDSDKNNEESSDGQNLFCLKPETEIFVLSIDGVPQFYTKSVDVARERMWYFARTRRIQETHYNTYVRGYGNKNQIEVVGCNKFSVFFVDRVICRLVISQIQELSNLKEDDPVTFAPPEDDEPISPPPKRGFFSSLFW